MKFSFFFLTYNKNRKIFAYSAMYVKSEFEKQNTFDFQCLPTKSERVHNLIKKCIQFPKNKQINYNSFCWSNKQILNISTSNGNRKIQ